MNRKKTAIFDPSNGVEYSGFLMRFYILTYEGAWHLSTLKREGA